MVGEVSEPYDVEGFHPSRLPSGTTVLLLASTDRQRAVVERFLDGPSECTDHPLAVTDSRDSTIVPDGGVVDRGDADSAAPTASRLDVRAVGVRVCQSLDETADRPVRVAIYDVDSLLEAVDVQTAYRFFHVVAGTVARTESLGLFALDVTRWDVKAVNVFRRVFDYVADSRSTPAGEPIPLASVG